MKFRTTILQTGKTAAGIVIPEEVVLGLNSGRKPAVKVTIKGYTYRNTVATMGGKFMISVSSEVREKAGVSGGETVDVTLELDTEPRIMEVPEDMAKALAAEPKAKAFWDTLSYSKQRWHIDPINGAKTEETRQRRIEKSVSMLVKGIAQ